jgi:hypothetical protein
VETTARAAAPIDSHVIDGKNTGLVLIRREHGRYTLSLRARLPEAIVPARSAGAGVARRVPAWRRIVLRDAAIVLEVRRVGDVGRIGDVDDTQRRDGIRAARGGG